MWETLENHPINEGLEDPRVADYEGEQWQYICTYTNKDRTKFITEFRHRNHPKTNDVYFIRFSTENKINEEDIFKTIKIK
jgi:hypothetical protein